MCFSNFNVHMSHPKILLKCRFFLNRFRKGPENLTHQQVNCYSAKDTSNRKALWNFQGRDHLGQWFVTRTLWISSAFIHKFRFPWVPQNWYKLLYVCGYQHFFHFWRVSSWFSDSARGLWPNEHNGFNSFHFQMSKLRSKKAKLSDSQLVTKLEIRVSGVYLRDFWWY